MAGVLDKYLAEIRLGHLIVASTERREAMSIERKQRYLIWPFPKYLVV